MHTAAHFICILNDCTNQAKTTYSIANKQQDVNIFKINNWAYQKIQTYSEYLRIQSEHCPSKGKWVLSAQLKLTYFNLMQASRLTNKKSLILRLLMSYIYGAPSKARNANVVYIWTYVWQR